jgi:hypothetical protein
MTLVLILGTAWAVVAAPVGLLIGRAVRLADAHETGTAAVVPDFVPESWTQPAGSR